MLKKNYCCYGLIVVAAILIYLIETSKDVEEGMTSSDSWNWLRNLFRKATLSGRPDDQPLSHPASYPNRHMTCKPFGYQHLPYYYFKHFGKNFPEKYRSCDKYRCQTKRFNGYNAKPDPEWKDVDGLYPTKTDAKGEIAPDYYHDPYSYCKKNPGAYPCPNFWVKDSELVGAERLAKHPTENMRIPKLKKGVHPQVKTYCKNNNYNESSGCAVNDNSAFMPIYPGTEDHALCGYVKRGCQN